MVLDLIRKRVEGELSGDSTGHDLYHAVRVYNLGERIGQEERADLLVVGAAAYLHDLSRPREKELKVLNYHVSLAALGEIEKILEEVKFPEEKIKGVLEVIELHEEYSFGVGSGRGNSLEGLVLQDADRLDAIGAIGLARCFMFGGYYGRPMWVPGEIKNQPYEPTKMEESTIQHFYDKLLRIKEAMNTATGRRIAEERHRFMEEFLERFFKEWEGKE